MPRKSAAALAVVAGSIDSRPQPPKDLTDVQKEIWRQVTASENSGFFNTAALRRLLEEFCRHAEACDVLAKSINSFNQDWLATDEGLARYDVLLRMRDRESKALSMTATKLRLTNQSRYIPSAAATAAKHTTTAKPWERSA